MRTQYSAALSLALGTLLLAGAGCTPDTTDTTNTTNTTNTNTVTVQVDDDAVVDDADVTEDDATTDGTADDATAEAASVSITEPIDGDIVGSTFDLTVAIEGLTLAPDKVEGANVEGEGHYHVWVDGEYFAPGVAETTTLEGLEAGEHELMVSLQNNDHTDLDPTVSSDPISVTVE